MRRRGQNIAEEKPEPTDPRTLTQLSWRHMYQKCAALWHTLSDAEKQDWQTLAASKHMTGFALWQSSCLKPNPGIYLPLQGGSMSGDIEMNKNRILELPLPLDSQEALTLEYFTANIAPYLYNEGCRITHSTDQSIPHNTNTILAFNTEVYDTDSMHDTVVNNSRITCKTAGKYLIITHVSFATNAINRRWLRIRLNNTSDISYVNYKADPNGYTTMLATTIYVLSPNDYIEVQVYQNSGNPLNITSPLYISPYFLAQRIGS